MNESPYIRETAFDFFEQQTNKSNPMNNSIQRNVLEGALFHYIRDIEKNGRNSSRFLEFRDYFTDIDFRLSTASS
jgi:hypothetical protein